MNSMFSGCSALESVKWCSGYKTSNVTDMASMFFNCKALKSPGIKGLNTSRVTDMSNLFNGCASLKNLDLGDSFDTSSVTNMASMFKGCTSLIRLNLGSFDTSNVTSMTTMFQNCSALTMFDLSNFNTGNVTTMFGMFSGCSSARRMYVDDGWDTSSVTSDSHMFFNCSHLEGGNGTVFDSDYIDRIYACIDSEGQPGYFSWKTCVYDAKTRTLNLRGAVNYDEVNSYRDGHIEVLSIVADEGTVLPEDCSYLFDSFKRVSDIDLSNADTSNVNNMQNMFSQAYSLRRVTFGSEFNTGNVTSMKEMFCGCYELESLDLSNFNTENVTDMSQMFSDCIKLPSLDLSSFDTSKVTDMNGMFKECWHLGSVTFGSNFKTGNVTDMNGMFCYCTDLKDLDLSSFNTSNVKDMQDMFCACGLLTELDLSSFDTSNVKTMFEMFDSCEVLETIYVSNKFNVNNGTDSINMFRFCNSLVGGNGTTYNEAKTNAEYAVIDGTDGNPGYFTGSAFYNLEFKHNCSFNNDLSMYYAIPKNDLAEYSNIRLKVLKEEYDEGASEPTIKEKTITNYSTTTIAGTEYYMFTFDGITSTDMGSKLTATLYADRNGTTFATKDDIYSVKEYALDRLEKSTSATYKKMLVDMLNYGAAAQVHFNKNASDLVNKDLTEAQKALGTKSLPALNNKEKSIALSGATAQFAGKNIAFENKTILAYRMTFPANQNMSNVKLKLTYKTSTGESVTNTIPASSFTKDGNYYIAYINSIAITDVRSVISATIYNGNKAISNTLEYSIESYAKNRLSNSNNESFKTLITEMMEFGISSETHFS